MAEQRISCDEQKVIVQLMHLSHDHSNGKGYRETVQGGCRTKSPPPLHPHPPHPTPGHNPPQ